MVIFHSYVSLPEGIFFFPTKTSSTRHRGSRRFPGPPDGNLLGIVDAGLSDLLL
jgi:hypothetical protein